MKNVLSVMLLLGSFSTLACPEIKGRFYCPEEAQDPWALNASSIYIAKSAKYNAYVVKIEDTAMIYEKNIWNYAMDPFLETEDKTIETRATCEDNKVSFYTKTAGLDEESDIYEVTPTESGVDIRILVGEVEFFKFSCTK